MTSESTRFLGQPNETKPTVGAVGWEALLTFLLYPEPIFPRFSKPLQSQLYFLAAFGETPAAVKTPLASAENSPLGSSSRYFWYASAHPAGSVIF